MQSSRLQQPKMKNVRPTFDSFEQEYPSLVIYPGFVSTHKGTDYSRASSSRTIFIPARYIDSSYGPGQALVIFVQRFKKRVAALSRLADSCSLASACFVAFSIRTRLENPFHRFSVSVSFFSSLPSSCLSFQDPRVSAVLFFFSNRSWIFLRLRRTRVAKRCLNQRPWFSEIFVFRNSKGDFERVKILKHFSIFFTSFSNVAQ